MGKQFLTPPPRLGVFLFFFLNRLFLVLEQGPHARSLVLRERFRERFKGTGWNGLRGEGLSGGEVRFLFFLDSSNIFKSAFYVFVLYFETMVLFLIVPFVLVKERSFPENDVSPTPLSIFLNNHLAIKGYNTSKRNIKDYNSLMRNIKG